MGLYLSKIFVFKSSKIFWNFLYFSYSVLQLDTKIYTMPIFVNAFIQKVADHPQIIDTVEDIYPHQGKWSAYF